MLWLEVLGWLGALFTLTAYSMRSMQKLRVSAVAANVFFISYGALAHVYPMLVLHLVLLPLNLYRLFEIFSAKSRLRATRHGADPIAALKPFLKPSRFSEGHVLFRKGEPADSVYYIVEGSVDLPEIGITLGAGELFGEMAYFTRDRKRTATAICRGDCQIMSIDEVGFMRIFNTHPEFGIYVVRLIAQRLVEGNRQNPELYRGLTPE